MRFEKLKWSGLLFIGLLILLGTQVFANTTVITDERSETILASEPFQNESITIKTNVTFLEKSSVSGVWLAGLSINDKTQPTALAISWAPVASGWFGEYWGIQLQSDRGLIPKSLGGKPGSGFLKGSNFVTLHTVEPEIGHEYEVVFTYNSSTGDADVLVTDVTLNTLVFRRNLKLEPFSEPFYVGVGEAQKSATTKDLVSLEFQTYPTFVPIGLSWWVSEWDEVTKSYITVNQINRQKETGIRFRFPWQEISGEFQVWLDDGASKTQIASVKKPEEKEVYLPINKLTELSVGSYTLTILYVAEDLEWIIGQSEVSVGYGVLGIKASQSVNLDRWVATIKGEIDLSVDGFVDQVELYIKGENVLTDVQLGGVVDSPTLLDTITLYDLDTGIHQVPFSVEVALEEDKPYQSWEAVLQVDSDLDWIKEAETRVKLLDLPRQIFIAALDSPDTSTGVTWRTDKKADVAVLYYSTDPNASLDKYQSITPQLITYRESDNAWIYTARLDGLSPETEYTFVIQSDYYYTLPQTFVTASSDWADKVQTRRAPDLYFPFDRNPLVPEFSLVRPAYVEYVYYQELDRYVKHVHMLKGEEYGVEYNYNFTSSWGTPSGIDELHMSYWVYFPESFTAGPNHIKTPGIAHRDRHGWGGRGSDGTGGWSVRLILTELPDTSIKLNYYVYHADTKGSGWGSTWPWEGSVNRGEWIQIENYVKVNTPGQKDGVIRGWVNGELKYEKTDIAFRAEGYDQYDIAEIMWHVWNGGPSPYDQHVVYRDLELWIGGLDPK